MKNRIIVGQKTTGQDAGEAVSNFSGTIGNVQLPSLTHGVRQSGLVDVGYTVNTAPFLEAVVLDFQLGKVIPISANDGREQQMKVYADGCDSLLYDDHHVSESVLHGAVNAAAALSSKPVVLDFQCETMRPVAQTDACQSAISVDSPPVMCDVFESVLQGVAHTATAIPFAKPVVLDFQTRMVRSAEDVDAYAQSTKTTANTYNSLPRETDFHEYVTQAVTHALSSLGTVKAHIGKIIWSSSGWRHNSFLFSAFSAAVQIEKRSRGNQLLQGYLTAALFFEASTRKLLLNRLTNGN